MLMHAQEPYTLVTPHESGSVAPTSLTIVYPDSDVIQTRHSDLRVTCNQAPYYVTQLLLPPAGLCFSSYVRGEGRLREWDMTPVVDR